MQYGQQAADEMQAKETLFKNFFQNVEVVMRQHNTVKHRSKWDVSSVTETLHLGCKTHHGLPLGIAFSNSTLKRAPVAFN